MVLLKWTLLNIHHLKYQNVAYIQGSPFNEKIETKAKKIPKIDEKLLLILLISYAGVVFFSVKF